MHLKIQDCRTMSGLTLPYAEENKEGERSEKVTLISRALVVYRVDYHI